MDELKRFINHSRFQNNFQFSTLRFLHFEGNMFSGYFLDYPSDMTEIHTHVTHYDFTLCRGILKNILDKCFPQNAENAMVKIENYF